MILNILMHNIFLSAKIIAPYMKRVLKSRAFHQHTIKGGLTLPAIENFIVLISFIRFTVFAIRYNLRTSFLITCISLYASTLWYIHLAKIVVVYKGYVMNAPHLKGLKLELLKTYTTKNQIEEYQIPWYRPGLILYYGLVKGITNNKYYIDPISMILSKLPESQKVKLLPLYYNTYNQFIPWCAKMFGNGWNQMGEIVVYTTIARLGRQLCPYLVRWHWSFILILIQIEYLLAGLFDRAMFYRNKVLLPQLKFSHIVGFDRFRLDMETQATNLVLGSLICSHLGLIIFALVNALLGQFFYLPFLVENTEVHTGFRPTNSVYSRGQTPWQTNKNFSYFDFDNVSYFSVLKSITIFGLVLSVGYIFYKGLENNSILLRFL